MNPIDWGPRTRWTQATTSYITLYNPYITLYKTYRPGPTYAMDSGTAPAPRPRSMSLARSLDH